MAEMTGKKFDALSQWAGGIAALQIARIEFLDIVVTALDAADVDGLAATTLLVLEVLSDPPLALSSGR